MPAKSAADANYVGGDKNIRGKEILLGKVGMTFQLLLFIWEALMSQFSSMVLGNEGREQMIKIKMNVGRQAAGQERLSLSLFPTFIFRATRMYSFM